MGCFGSEPSVHSPGHTFKISSTKRRTGSRADGSGPKLKPWPNAKLCLLR